MRFPFQLKSQILMTFVVAVAGMDLSMAQSRHRQQVYRNTGATQPTLERVVCIKDQTLGVRTPNLRTVMFGVKRFERLNVFQGWGTNKKRRTIRGVRYTFVKVQFPDIHDQSTNIGWVAESYIKPKHQCPGATDMDRDENEPAPRTPKVPQVDDTVASRSDAKVRGLKDPLCCEFPIGSRPTADYTSGMRRFGANRSRGRRAHAACDLYKYHNTPILAVTHGKVLSPLYYFYQGTYALEVKHSGGFIVRYGEITSRRAKNVSAGRSVSPGQVIGYMGTVNSGCCEPMLHFELYAGTRRGGLSGGGRFQRRADLMNPTPYLQRWEAKKFYSNRIAQKDQ